MNFKHLDKKFWFLLMLLIIIALGIRTARVFLYEQPVFADEAIYIRWAQVMRAEPTLRFLPLSDGKQPIFMWSMIPLFKIFDDPIIAGRMLSVFVSSGTILGVVTLSLLFFSSIPAAILAGLIYALSPYAVFFDSLALVDSMLSLFGIWTLVLGILTIKLKRLDFAMLTGFCLGGALLTKSPGIYFALLLPSTLFFSSFKSKKSKVKEATLYVSLLVVTYFIGFGIYQILRLGPNFHMLSQRSLDYVFPLTHILTSPLDPLVSFLDRSFEWFLIWGPAALVLLIVAGALLNIKTYWKEVVILLIWSLVPLIVSAEFAKVFTARYVVYLLPTLAVIAGSVMLAKRHKFLLRLMVAIFIIHALIIDFLLITNIQKAPMPRDERSGYLEEWTSGYGIREIAETLKEIKNSNSDEKIVVGTEGYFGTLPDGLQAYLQDTPEITVIGVGIDLTDVPQSLIDSNRSGNKTFLVINSSRLLFKPEEKRLKLISAYTKALRVQGTKEYNIHGPQDALNLFEIVK